MDFDRDNVDMCQSMEECYQGGVGTGNMCKDDNSDMSVSSEEQEEAFETSLSSHEAPSNNTHTQMHTSTSTSTTTSTDSSKPIAAAHDEPVEASIYNRTTEIQNHDHDNSCMHYTIEDVIEYRIFLFTNESLQMKKQLPPLTTSMAKQEGVKEIKKFILKSNETSDNGQQIDYNNYQNQNQRKESISSESDASTASASTLSTSTSTPTSTSTSTSTSTVVKFHKRIRQLLEFRKIYGELSSDSMKNNLTMDYHKSLHQYCKRIKHFYHFHYQRTQQKKQQQQLHFNVKNDNITCDDRSNTSKSLIDDHEHENINEIKKKKKKKKKTMSLTHDQIDILNGIGFDWSISASDSNSTTHTPTMTPITPYHHKNQDQDLTEKYNDENDKNIDDIIDVHHAIIECENKSLNHETSKVKPSSVVAIPSTKTMIPSITKPQQQQQQHHQQQQLQQHQHNSNQKMMDHETLINRKADRNNINHDHEIFTVNINSNINDTNCNRLTPSSTLPIDISMTDQEEVTKSKSLRNSSDDHNEDNQIPIKSHNTDRHDDDDDNDNHDSKKKLHSLQSSVEETMNVQVPLAINKAESQSNNDKNININELNHDTEKIKSKTPKAANSQHDINPNRLEEHETIVHQDDHDIFNNNNHILKVNDKNNRHNYMQRQGNSIDDDDDVNINRLRCSINKKIATPSAAAATLASKTVEEPLYYINNGNEHETIVHHKKIAATTVTANAKAVVEEPMVHDINPRNEHETNEHETIAHQDHSKHDNNTFTMDNTNNSDKQVPASQPPITKTRKITDPSSNKGNKGRKVSISSPESSRYYIEILDDDDDDDDDDDGGGYNGINHDNANDNNDVGVYKTLSESSASQSNKRRKIESLHSQPTTLPHEVIEIDSDSNDDEKDNGSDDDIFVVDASTSQSKLNLEQKLRTASKKREAMLFDEQLRHENLLHAQFRKDEVHHRGGSRVINGTNDRGNQKAHFAFATGKSACDNEANSEYIGKKKNTFERFQNFYNYNFLDRDAAKKEQDRLLHESATRVKKWEEEQKRRMNLSNTAPSNCINGHSIVTKPILDVKKLPSNHWKWTDPYCRLGLPPKTNFDSVKRNYRRLCLLYHPDKARCDDAASRFQAIKEAYETITDQLGL